MSDIDWFAETQRIILDNLPTVHRSNYVAPDAELVIDPLLDFEPVCEFPGHIDNTEGCNGGPAAYLCVYPCCGRTGFVCAGRKDYWINVEAVKYELGQCSLCGVVAYAREFKFIPLDGAS